MREKTFSEIEYEAWSQRAALYEALFASVSTQAIDPILDSLGILKGRRHVDIACGTGHLVAEASRRGAVSEGIDFAQVMIDMARTNYPGERYQIADATVLPYDDRSFDAVTCAFGLPHMEHPMAALREVWRVLKPGGRFAFTLWFGPDEGNDLHKIIQEAFQSLGVIPVVMPDQWKQLRSANQQVCEALTSQAGFGPPVFKKVPIVWHIKSAQDAVDVTVKLSVRTKMVIDHQSPAVQRQILEYIYAQAEARRKNGVISLIWPALITVVQKP